ncbi:MAG: CooT family nickel-binding protein [Bacillota bacterium]|nr:CooT family nickel-binding protein [Bacillota bacterium]
MCLSTVYTVINGSENKIKEYVCNIELDGNNITLTDIMGDKITVQGKLKSMDFVKNFAIIDSEE